jgi:hypothetical protein
MAAQIDAILRAPLARSAATEVRATTAAMLADPTAAAGPAIARPGLLITVSPTPPPIPSPTPSPIPSPTLSPISSPAASPAASPPPSPYFLPASTAPPAPGRGKRQRAHTARYEEAIAAGEIGATGRAKKRRN